MHALCKEKTVHVITGHVKINDLDIGKISKALCDGKRMAFYVTDFFKNNMPGFENASLSTTADDLGMRATRWIEG